MLLIRFTSMSQPSSRSTMVTVAGTCVYPLPNWSSVTMGPE